MDAFFILIYIGGAYSMPDRKIGFWRRVFWPELLGEKIAEWVQK